MDGATQDLQDYKAAVASRWFRLRGRQLGPAAVFQAWQSLSQRRRFSAQAIARRLWERTDRKRQWRAFSSWVAAHREVQTVATANLRVAEAHFEAEQQHAANADAAKEAQAEVDRVHAANLEDVQRKHAENLAEVGRVHALNSAKLDEAFAEVDEQHAANLKAVSAAQVRPSRHVLWLLPLPPAAHVLRSLMS